MNLTKRIFLIIMLISSIALASDTNEVEKIRLHFYNPEVGTGDDLKVECYGVKNATCVKVGGSVQSNIVKPGEKADFELIFNHDGAAKYHEIDRIVEINTKYGGSDSSYHWKFLSTFTITDDYDDTTQAMYVDNERYLYKNEHDHPWDYDLYLAPKRIHHYEYDKNLYLYPMTTVDFPPSICRHSGNYCSERNVIYGFPNESMDIHIARIDDIPVNIQIDSKSISPSGPVYYGEGHKYNFHFDIEGVSRSMSVDPGTCENNWDKYFFTKIEHKRIDGVKYKVCRIVPLHDTWKT